MQRNKTVDICKGIGIISIVIGHASWVIQIGGMDIEIGPFVYLYHLAIFFFVSGYLFKEIDLQTYIINRVKSLYIPFIKYSLLYLILRAAFVHWGWIDGVQYTFGEYIITFTNAISFIGNSEFLSAFWFLPTLFCTMCIFAVVSYMTRNIKGNAREIIRFIICLCIGMLGLYTTDNQFGLIYNWQIAYLMVFVVEAGCLLKRYEIKIRKFFNPIVLIISFAILLMVVKSDIGLIELSKFMIIGKKYFYPVTFVGIIFCLCLSVLIEKFKRLADLVAYIGRNSLHIMAMHFFAIKCIDWICCVLLGDFSKLSCFPYSFPKLWFVYYIGGIGIPLAIAKLYNVVLQKIKIKKG